MKKLVILGGGYGGLTIANRLLDKDLPKDTIIEMVDRMPFQGLKTEYYALASGTVSESEVRVAFPADPRLVLRYGEITSINLEERLVHLEGQDPLSYDILIIGLGCVDKYHNIPGAEHYTNSIQTMCATRKTYQNVNDVKPYGQVSIIGGGLSGVEMAAELRESRPDLNIRIIDRGPSVLSSFPEKLQRFARGWFEEHDIEMRSRVSLCRIEGGMLLNGDEPIYTDCTIWTAGIQPSEVVQNLNLPKDGTGRLIINKYHQVESRPEIYIVGDCASLPFSPSGQAAMAQGDQIADVILDLWKGETPKLGQIKLKGVLGSLGKKSGFGLLGKNTVMTGTVPRFIKSGVLWRSKHHFG